jgi:hypothetical protein
VALLVELVRFAAAVVLVAEWYLLALILSS